MSTSPDTEYPDPICQMCGQPCERSEEVFTGPGYWCRVGPVELWCYCETCDVDTFHPIPSISTD